VTGASSIHYGSSEEEVAMRHWLRSAALLGTAALLLLAGCGSDTSSTGFSSVTITGEERQTLAGNRCAIQGHATNAGNNRAHVQINYNAKDAQGTVIATSTAEFEVAPFSNFDFSNTVLNNQGQPSSTAFTNNVSCGSISDFDRTNLDVHAA
jgi:hypothetical protein